MLKQKKISQLSSELKISEDDRDKLRIKNAELKSDYRHAEDERQSLKAKVKCLQEAMDSHSGDVKTSQNNEQPLPRCPSLTSSQSTQEDVDMFDEEEEQQAKPDDQNISDLMPEASGLIKYQSKAPKPTQSPIKDTTNLKQFNIMKKGRLDSNSKPKVFNDKQFYDGMGGHSKLDLFPRPMAKRTLSSSKRPKGISRQSSLSQKVVKDRQRIDKFFNFETP